MQKVHRHFWKSVNQTLPVNSVKRPLLLVSRFVPYSAIAVYPFVILKSRELSANSVLIHHEKIHHRQQIELLILPFYLLYIFNYLFNLLKYRQHYKAYREIVFEREAYAHENDLEYLSQRKFFAFINYL